MKYFFSNALLIAVMYMVTPCAKAQFDTQNMTARLGEEIRFTLQNAFVGFNPLGYNQDGFFAEQVPYNEVYNYTFGGVHYYHLAKYTDISKEPKRIELNLSFGGKPLDYEKTIVWQNRVWVLSTFQNYKQQKTYLFAQSVNTTSMTLNGDLNKIAEIDYSKENKYEYSDFLFEFSPDSSKLLVQYGLYNKFSEVLNMGLVVFDGHFNTVWENDNMRLPVPAGGILKFKQYRVADNGQVHILTQIYDNEKAFNKAHDWKKKNAVIGPKVQTRNSQFHYRLYSLLKNGTELTQYSLKEVEGFASDVQLGISKSNTITLAGLLAKKEPVVVNGTFYVALDAKASKAVQSKVHFFKQDFIYKASTEKERNGSGSSALEECHYRMERLHFFPNGDICLLAEQFYDEYKTTGNARIGYTSFHGYREKDILVFRFDTNGNLLWQDKVDKDQKTVKLGVLYGSYKPVFNENQLHLFYNQIPDKALSWEGDLYKSTLNVSSFDKDGNLATQEVFSLNKNKLPLQPQLMAPLQSGKWCIYGTKKRFYRLVELTLK